MKRIVLFCVATLLAGTALAQSDYEREQIRLMLLQLQNIEALGKQMESNTRTLDSDRYRFDHSRFDKDLKAVRAGLEHYLTPSRAQPRDVADLNGQYQKERGTKHGND
ncbi:MAG: RAQPRD family plasmid [Burkholderiales bacterium]|jgi:RAQPRD family integrative conjugative element protein|nr:RAQPRD family plasmid [Burkholderiales bacterium]